jgi:glucokinase
MPPVLAVDLGGTKTMMARVDDDGTVVDRRKMPAARTLDGTLDQVASGADDVAAVGIIVPGIYTPSTGSAWCPNLWGPEEVPLADGVRRRIAAPVAIDSDRAGAVVGEAWLGAARGLRDVVFVAIGTGIGVGILSDGHVVRGAHGIAGAAGWFALDPAWTDEYAAAGCWEAESSGAGLARRFGAGDGASVVNAARQGDSRARTLLERAARYTGMGIANLVSALNPEIVLIGGGLGAATADLLLDPVRAEMRRWAQPLAAAKCRVEMSRLGEDAGLLGAARFALDALSCP